MHPHLVFDLGEIAVEFAAKVDQQSVVGKFEERFDDILGRDGGVSALMPKDGSFCMGLQGKSCRRSRAVWQAKLAAGTNCCAE